MNLIIDNSGSGNIEVLRNAKNLDIKTEGSGNFYRYHLLTENTKIKISGSSNCEINCTNSLEVTIQGNGSVYYKGTPSKNYKYFQVLEV